MLLIDKSFFRVAIKTHEDNEKLIKALKEIDKDLIEEKERVAI